MLRHPILLTTLICVASFAGLAGETSPEPLLSNLPPKVAVGAVTGTVAGQAATEKLPALVVYRPEGPDSGTVPGTLDSAPPPVAVPLPAIPSLDGNQILAFYGRPGTKSMGILGEYPKEELATLLLAYSQLYDEANGDAGIIPAFYIVYGTCWPAGDIGYLRDQVVRDYIDYAAKNGILVFLDNQIGKYGVDEAIKRLLPFLEYPNVHLALDPEWRTIDPMKTIGSISADELNQAQSLMSDYLRDRGLPGERILVVHQFTAKMISSRDKVRSDYPAVRLIHTSDGFGSPALKRSTYYYNATAANMPRKGLKLFMKTDVRGAGYDEPLLTPPEVLALLPAPELVIYQ